MQVVVLGAGYDTRWYRLYPQLGSVALYIEVDFPMVLSKKSKLLPPPPGPETISRYKTLGFDLSSEKDLFAELASLGLTIDEPFIMIVECCFMYLERTHLRRLLSRFAEMTNLHLILFEPLFRSNDHFSITMLDNLKMRGIPLDPIWVDSLLDISKMFHLQRPPLTLRQLEDSLFLSDEDRSLLRHKIGLDEYEEWNLIGDHYFFISENKSLSS